MKVYKVEAKVFDYYYDIDRSGFVKEEKYFSTKEKAEEWMKNNAKYAHGFEGREAQDKYEMPKFELIEIEVE